MPARNFCIELSGISCMFGTKRQVTRLISLAPYLKSKHSLEQCHCFLWFISTNQIQVHGDHQPWEVSVTMEGSPKCWRNRLIGNS